jgi:hypothetical protein
MAVTDTEHLEVEATQLRRQLALVDDVLTESQQLRQRVQQLVERITGPAPISQVRDALNEVGIQKARSVLREAPDLVANAKVTLRQAQDAERTAREQHADALLEAEWELATHFVVRSNKTWLAVDADGASIVEDDQRSMTADEKKAWIAHHGNQAPAVKAALHALRSAEENTAAARDDVSLAEARLSVAKHDLDAAAVQLRAFTLALPREDLR